MNDNIKNLMESELPKPLSKQEVYTLFEKYHLGDLEARDKIVNHNIRLVRYEVFGKFKTFQWDKNELFSVGLDGLLKAVMSFDTSKNTEFATYATRCIDNEILMFMRKVKKYETNISFDQALSIDNDGNELKIEEILYDEKIDIVTNYEEKETLHRVQELIKTLPLKEKRIILLHFGFIGDRIYTQKEIANMMNISQSYVSRLVKKILKKLQNDLTVKSNKSKKYSIFDIHCIHPNITFSIFSKLLLMFPKNEIKLFTKFYNINLHLENIRPVEEQDYPDIVLEYIKTIEQDLKNMYIYFENLTIKRGLDETTAYEKIKKRMISKSIRFRFPNYTRKQLIEAANKLSNKDKEILCLRHGKNLLTTYDLPKDGKNYYSVLYHAYNKLESILENRIPTINKNEANKNEEKKVLKKQRNTLILARLYQLYQWAYLHNLTTTDLATLLSQEKYSNYEKNEAQIQEKIEKKIILELVNAYKTNYPNDYATNIYQTLIDVFALKIHSLYPNVESNLIRNVISKTLIDYTGTTDLVEDIILLLNKKK